MNQIRKAINSLTLERLFKIVLFVGIFALATQASAVADTWWHLASGRYIWQTRSVPLHDPFSFTVAGRPWTDVYWLAQLAMYLLYCLAGFGGLNVAVAACATAALALLFRQGAVSPYLKGFVVLLAALTAAPTWVARPHVLSFVLTAAFGYILYVYKYEGRNHLWAIPLLFVLWVNVHGGFIVGFILLAGVIGGEALGRLLGGEDEQGLSWPQIVALVKITLLSVPLLLLNPQTYRTPLLPFQTVGMGAVRDLVQEWASPNFHRVELQPFAWMALLLLAAVGISARRASYTDLLLTSVFFYMGLLAWRNVALFALVAAPVLMRHGAMALDVLRQVLRERTGLGPLLARAATGGKRLAVVNWLVLLPVLVAAGVKVSLPLGPRLNRELEERAMPARAVRFVRENNPPGPLFNNYDWGGYIIWKLWPDYPVFIDGRTDLYDGPFIREYIDAVGGGEEWESLLDRYGVNLVFIEAGSPLATFLAEEPGWRQIYLDEQAALFSRDAPVGGGGS
jgi:hypothetical protein